jgi:glycosyltransferase involved in cell wall biosynthesis
MHTLNQLAHKQEGVQVLIRRERGKAEVRNFGISRSQGKYICCLDSGNTIEPTYFEKRLFLLETNPGVSFTYPLVKFLADNCRIR